MSKMVIWNGREAELVSRNGGWSTIIDSNGTCRKVRNGEITEQGAAPAKAAKPDRVKAPKADKPKKAPKRKDKDDEEVDYRLIKADLSRYAKGLAKTASGRATVDIDDGVAAKFRGCDIDDVYTAAADILGVKAKELREMYGHLNLGMQRMNLGNRCRAAVKAAQGE